MTDLTYDAWLKKVDEAPKRAFNDDERASLLKIVNEPIFIRAIAVMVDEAEKASTSMLGFDLRDPAGLQQAIDAQMRAKTMLKMSDFFWNLTEKTGQ